MDRFLAFLVGAVATLAAAITLAVQPKHHDWTSWYVLFLLVVAGLLGVGAVAALAHASFLAKPRLSVGEPFVATRAILKKATSVHLLGEPLPGTIPYPTSGSAAWTASGEAVALTATTHPMPGESVADFAYLAVRNRPRRRGRDRDAENVSAHLRFFDSTGTLLHEMHGRWSVLPQHGHIESILQAEAITIPGNGDPHYLDVAFKYLEDKECYAFNEENRFFASDDLRHRPLGPGPVAVEVILTGSNTTANGRFELTHGGRGKTLILTEATRP